MKLSPELDRTSRIFVDTLSRLYVLTNLRFKDLVKYKAIELIERVTGNCVAFRIPSLGGYVVSCQGEVVAASLKDPPALGSQAIAFLGEEEFEIVIYELPRESFEKALKLLDGITVNEEQLEEFKGKLAEILEKVLSKEAKSEEKEAIEIPEVISQAPPLEVLDLIDLVTISDEIAYFLSKNGIEAESQTPEEVNGMMVAVIKIKEPSVDLRSLFEKLYEASKRAELKSLLKVITSDGRTYYFDSVTYDTVLKILDRFGINESPLLYIESNGEAVLNIILESKIWQNLIPRMVASITSALSTRNFPWKRTYVKVRLGDLELTGEIIPQSK
ncbi:hypothetical protein EYM_00670 [Ignicoccus islandicus DSM 13165]|uniref:Uncharacterized protein n=1 Tax=Ignicoccus islandicus DSM 13165 TaxID=940295 RepID=A0A0U3ECF1_9CREN|nr:hypothetical protein [Ignicoccus islandicus]ALU12131.1 hypothetical protein EYM_00670 [Ignicoccus islandicus DSM 13165]